MKLVDRLLDSPNLGRSGVNIGWMDPPSESEG